MLEIVLTLIGGLVLFLYAVGNLSETVKEWAGEKARDFIARFTKNIFSAIVVGIVVTTVLDSSSAVIILTIVLVNAGTLSFKQAIGIVMGANIGTTISSQIIAMDVGKYSPIALIIGLALLIISHNPKINRTGKILLYFGMLFFGLFTMENAVEPLREHPQFAEWMIGLETPLYGALIGGLVTVIIQSSSATVGMVITLAKQSLITLPAGIAVMLGAELGTCADTLLATVRSNRQALKTGLFHLFFNLLTVGLGLLLFVPFVALIKKISGDIDIKNQIANAHLLFNVSGVLLLVAFVPYFEKLLNKLLPDTGKEKPVLQ
jgi:phosphate:Na+ symporter